MTISLHAPLLPAEQDFFKNLRAGDRVLIQGTLYSARDAAHKKMFELLASGKSLPFDPQGAFIYYVGPSPAPEGAVIGSAGPTTSSRMDAYTPVLLDSGVKGLIGKGYRNQEVKDSLICNQALYFAATGGAGALLSKSILSAEVIAWPELGTEAVRKLTVRDFPVTVAIDLAGNCVYESGPAAWKKARSEF